MIYVLGDSFSFGWNFFKDKNPNREKLIYPSILSQRFEDQVINFSTPGGSNWRMARLLLGLDIKPEDKVIIGWTSSDRLELGVRKDSISMLDDLVDINDLINPSKINDVDAEIVIDGVEKNGRLLTRKLFSSQFVNPDTIRNHKHRSFTKDFFTYYSTTEWFDLMFLQNFCSVLYKLQKSECRFLMFNTFTPAFTLGQNTLLEIPEYVLGPYKDMTHFIRKPKLQKYKNIFETHVEYWTESEHVTVADILYEEFNK